MKHILLKTDKPKEKKKTNRKYIKNLIINTIFVEMKWKKEILLRNKKKKQKQKNSN